MAKKKFTDTWLKALEKAAKAGKEQPRDIREGDGFGVSVLPSGKLSFFLFYTFAGHKKRIRFGIYPDISLADAHTEADRARVLVADGTDPSEQRSRKRRATEIAAEEHRKAPTIADLLEEHWSVELRHRKSGTELHRLLTKDVLPIWGKRKVKEITRRDVALLLDSVRERAPITANRLQGRLSRLFNFAAERGVIDRSPVERIPKPRETPKERTLNDDEIRVFWKSIEDVGLDQGTIVALKLTLLLGQRPGEIVGAAKAEFDRETGWWTIPAERMKGAKMHRVPLPPLALALIERAWTMSCDSAYLFPTQRGAGMDKPVAEHSLARAVSRKVGERQAGRKGDYAGLGMAKWTPHDLRRTARTKWAEIGIDDVVAERLLSHILQGMLAVYNRHTYDAEKRIALEAWERHLCKIVGETSGPATIIPLRTQRGAAHSYHGRLPD